MTERLLLELGQGGMGTVVLALAERPGGFRKLKVKKRLRPELGADPRFVRMFLDEARVSARLRHPNIAQTNEVVAEGASFVIEMEYLEGQTLEAIARRAALGLEAHVAILAQVLAGLEHAHAHGVVHRDVSPHNVMVTYDGDVKLLDFGIAKSDGALSETRAGVVKGKPTYMAPEQAAGEPVDARADVFAVGVMLWQACAQRRLWEARGDSEIFAALAAGEIPRLAEAVPDAPAELAAICDRALARDKEARFASAAEMQAALAAWLDARTMITARAIGDALHRAFAAERAAMRARIERELAGAREHASETTTPDADMTGARTLSSANEIATRAEGNAAKTPPAPRSRRRFAPAAIAATIAALAVAAPFAKPSRAIAPSAPAASTPVPARVPLASEDCEVHADAAALADDRTLWIGTMFPLRGAAADIGVPNANAAELARRELARIGGALPRRIGIVSCDDSANPRRAARHLADARVPAVVGFQSSAEVIDVATSTFLPRGMLTVAALNTSAMVTRVPQPGGERLIWRTTFNTAQTADAVARVVEQVFEPRVRAPAMRVALVRSATATGLAFSDALFSSLRWNGRSALEHGASSYRELVTGDPSRPDYAKVVDALLEFAPHVVVYVGDDELSANVLAPVEERWPKSAGHKPLWMSPGTLEGSGFFALLGKDGERRKRFFGLATPSATIANVQFTMRYNDAFDPDVTAPVSPSTPYDAVYAIAYAAFAAGDGAIDGAALSRGLSRIVPPGKPIDVGPSHVFDALEELRAGRAIDLNGAASRLDLDRTTGESPSDHVVLCVAADERGVAAESVESGMRYDARAKKLVGAMRCP